MASNRERIESLETEVRELKNDMNRLESVMTERFQQLEIPVNRILEVLMNEKKDTLKEEARHLQASNNKENRKDEAGGRINEEQKVPLTSFHLEGETNQWWQWLQRTFKAEGKMVTWAEFTEELWARFGPNEYEDFDELLSRVRQIGSLREYQREFEKLGDRVQGWMQKALEGTFMGGLKPELADGIQMFHPSTLKEAISLARMKDEQTARQKKIIQLPFNRTMIELPPPARANPEATVKRLTWEEMKKRRVQGLCFNCDEKFVPRHKCRRPQLLILEEISEDNEEKDEIALTAPTEQQHEPEI